MSASSPQPARKLGKQPAVVNPLIPLFTRLTRMAEAPPDSSNWWAEIGSWPMDLNDQLGCCVPAGVAHQILQRTSYAGQPVTLPDSTVDTVYRRWSGYDGSKATDSGCIMSAALADWVKTGILLPGGRLDKPRLLASVNHLSARWIKQAIWRCGGVLIGSNLPSRWLQSTYLFDLQPGDLADIAGGHCMFLPGYEKVPDLSIGTEYDVISWGQRFRMTEAALLATADEAYAIADDDWLNSRGIDPAGLDMAQADQAMQALLQSA